MIRYAFFGSLKYMHKAAQSIHKILFNCSLSADTYIVFYFFSLEHQYILTDDHSFLWDLCGCSVVRVCFGKLVYASVYLLAFGFKHYSILERYLFVIFLFASVLFVCFFVFLSDSMWEEGTESKEGRKERSKERKKEGWKEQISKTRNYHKTLNCKTLNCKTLNRKTRNLKQLNHQP